MCGRDHSDRPSERPPDNRAHRKAAMHAAAADYEAHGQLVGSNRRFLLARLEGGESAKRPGGVVPAACVRDSYCLSLMRPFTRALTMLMMIDPKKALKKLSTMMPLPNRPLVAHAASSSRSAFTTR